MLFEMGGQRPRVDGSAVIAPTAVLSGDVTVGPSVYISFGALLIGDDGPVDIREGTVVREHVVIRAGRRHPVRVGRHVLVGAHSALYGCTIEDEAFLATGVTVFHGARVGTRAEVRIGGVVHVNSVLESEGLVPIGWVAVGNPAVALPSAAHEDIWAVQQRLNFPGTVYGVERGPDGRVDMRLVTERAVIAARGRRWTPLVDDADPSKYP
jgi:carbonic anhydrase/acetyltransferase-like protein (isoleucine patch superfamily)